MEFQLSSFKSWKMMLWKSCIQYASKFGKLSSGHRTGKGDTALPWDYWHIFPPHHPSFLPEIVALIWTFSSRLLLFFRGFVLFCFWLLALYNSLDFLLNIFFRVKNSINFTCFIRHRFSYVTYFNFLFFFSWVLATFVCKGNCRCVLSEFLDVQEFFSVALRSKL